MDKKISLTSFLKLAKNRAKIEQLFIGTEVVVLTFNKVPLWDLRKHKPCKPEVPHTTLREWANAANGVNEG